MEVFKNLLQNYPVKSFPKGEMMLYQGEVPGSAYVVKSGIVRAYNISAEGDEKPIAFKMEMAIFPTAWVFKKKSSAAYFYEAYTDVEVYVIPLEELLNLVYTNVAFMRLLLDGYIKSSVAKSMRINALQYSKAADKILHILDYLIVMYGKELPNGTIVIELPLVQQELANLLGLTRETTAMQLGKLKRSGIIRQERHKIIINKEPFTQQLGEAEFLDLKL